GVGRGEAPLEGVEDQVEPELELVAVVVSRRQDVLGRQLGEVRVGVGGELRQDRLRHVPDRLGVERQGGLLQRESADVAVEQRERMGGQRDREAGAAEAADHRIVSDPMPAASATAIAPRSSRSRLSGTRCSAPAFGAIALPSSSAAIRVLTGSIIATTVLSTPYLVR